MSKSNKNVQDPPSSNGISEITTLDIISLISLRNIQLKDISYVKDHISIQKTNTKTTYEITVEDIDDQVYTLKVELKTYP